MLTRRQIVPPVIGFLTGCSGMPAAVVNPVLPLSVIVFPGGSNWPLWVAEDKGYFANERLAVTVTPTPNSTFQLKGLIEANFDIALTAMDNVIAYREGQGEAGVSGPDLVAVMGGDHGFLRLVAAPEIRSYSDLRGKTLSVDALTTGYAFVLFEMLERNGLKLNRDYKVVRAGGVAQRYQALLSREHAATILVTPFDLSAQAQGFRTLGNASDVLGHYQGVVAATRQGWARINSDKVSRYIRAYANSVEWLYAPANKQEALSIFLAHMPPGTTRNAAESAYGVLLAEGAGFQRKAKLDLAGVETVIKLRAKFGSAGVLLRDASVYYDSSFYEAAMKTTPSF